MSAFIRGTLATLQEGALVAGVDRTTIERWLKAERIDWQANRLRYLAGQRRRALMAAEGKSVRRPTKKEQRKRADDAKAEWERKLAAEAAARERGTAH